MPEPQAFSHASCSSATGAHRPGDAGRTFEGFRVSNGVEIRSYSNYYVAEFRQYRGYDAGLRDGVYNFGFLDHPALGNAVEHFPYQDGLLISYWDSSQSDISTSAHPGAGLILPIDAHPTAMYRGDGGIWRSRNQYYNPLTPTAGVINPNTGTQIRIKSVSALGNFMQIEVRPAK